MTDVQFGRLLDLPLRDAWKHEALQFTPWLAENIDHLSDAIGIPLELTGTEVAVESFSADILARNPLDDTIVLIENQLETTDHTHLGQIMTYLAGLEAHTVIWIAPAFREPHLSAIRWLNQHTADGFSFIAVKARVVRIGDSPFAPIFEVVEKPDGWGRALKKKAAAVAGSGFEAKEKFWLSMTESYPDLVAEGMNPGRLSNSWITLVEEPKLNVSLFVAQRSTGAFIRGHHGADAAVVHSILDDHRSALEPGLGQPLTPSETGRFFVTQIDKGYLNEADWPMIQSWLIDTYKTYRDTVRAAFAGTEADQ
jgi:hypothetical protein